MTTPDIASPDEQDDHPDSGSTQPRGAPGAEIGQSDEAGSTFEPEEDPEGA